MMSSTPTRFIATRQGEADDTARLREAIDRQCSKLIDTLDAAIRLRTAPGEVQRMRHMARSDLQGFALKALEAKALADSQE